MRTCRRCRVEFETPRAARGLIQRLQFRIPMEERGRREWAEAYDVALAGLLYPAPPPSEGPHRG